MSPSPLIRSLWESYRSLWDANYARLRKVFETGDGQKQSPLFTITRLEEKAKTEDSKDKAQWSVMIPPLPEPGKDYAKASKIFKKTFRQHSTSMTIESPRGTILISGLIELQNPKAILLLDVKACYDPRASQWVVLTAVPRRFQAKNQSPKG